MRTIDLMLEYQEKYPEAATDPLLKALIAAVREEENRCAGCDVLLGRYCDDCRDGR